MPRIVSGLTIRKQLLLSAAIILPFAVGLMVLLLSWPVRAPEQTSQSPTTTATPFVTNVDTRFLVMGDMFFGRYINDWSMASSLGYAYPFQALDEFNRAGYDAWVANLECPVTDNPKLSSAAQEATLTFDCSPEYLKQARSWFTAVSLGNNHTGNQDGQVGLKETRMHLDENGIQYFGSYDAEDTNNLCDIISMPVHVTMSDGTIQLGKLPVVWCGYDGVFATPSSASVAVVGRYTQLFTVIAMPHSGAEYQSKPDDIKKAFYRGLIDNGADVVIGNHPHWVQTSEAYKGHLIVYSLGNFIFDQQANPEVTRSAVLSVSASVTAIDAPDLSKWLALGGACASYHDDCLKEARKQELQKLPLRLHFSILGSTDSSKVTHLANNQQIDAIKQRLNWENTITRLGGRSSGE